MADNNVQTKWYEIEDKIQRNLKLAHDIEEKTKE